MTASCDAYIPPGAYLADARKGGVQVPHGQRHISEQTHAKIAEILERTLRQTSSRFLLQAPSSELARGRTTLPHIH